MSGTSGMLVGVSMKLHMTPTQTVTWASALRPLVERHSSLRSGRVELFVLPSVTALAGVQDVLAGSPVAIGAQDLFWADRGAFTGAISGADLAELGCRYVSVGGEERRRWFAETDKVVAWKLAAALRNGLVPVLSVGELTQMGALPAADTCVRHLTAILDEVDGLVDADLIVAYEPPDRVGAGTTPDPVHIAAVCAALRNALLVRRGIRSARVICGGSPGPDLLHQLRGAVDGLFLECSAQDPQLLNRVLEVTATFA